MRSILSPIFNLVGLHPVAFLSQFLSKPTLFQIGKVGFSLGTAVVLNHLITVIFLLSLTYHKLVSQKFIPSIEQSSVGNFDRVTILFWKQLAPFLLLFVIRCLVSRLWLYTKSWRKWSPWRKFYLGTSSWHFTSHWLPSWRKCPRYFWRIRTD